MELLGPGGVPLSMQPPALNCTWVGGGGRQGTHSPSAEQLQEGLTQTGLGGLQGAAFTPQLSAHPLRTPGGAELCSAAQRTPHLL